MQEVISIFLHFLSLALCPMIWSIPVKVPWAAENNGYCAVADKIFCRYQLGPFIYGVI
jgi:hypothetical protein